MAVKRSYCIFVNGDPPDFIINKYGDYGQQYLRMLREGELEEDWDIYRGFEGQLPDDETVSKYDALIFTGSKKDAYRTDDWLLRLRAIIEAAHARKQKILGICFGAQLVATALGGKVAPSNSGMQMGAVECTLVGDDPLLPSLIGEGSRYAIHEIHRDEIQALPCGARLLASSTLCPVEAFAMGDNLLALQGHPEFSKDFMECYLTTIAEQGLFPEDKCREWLSSLGSHDIDTPKWEAACRRFVKGGAGSGSS